MNIQTQEFLENYLLELKENSSDDFRYAEQYFRKTVKIENSLFIEPFIKTYTKPKVRVTLESVIDALQRLIRHRNKVTGEISNTVACIAPNAKTKQNELWQGHIVIDGKKYKIMEVSDE